MADKAKNKSLKYILVVLAIAIVAVFLVVLTSNKMPKLAEQLNIKKQLPTIESKSITDYASELENEIKLYDTDSSDLIKLESDSATKNLDKEVGNFNF